MDRDLYEARKVAIIACTTRHTSNYNESREIILRVHTVNLHIHTVKLDNLPLRLLCITLIITVYTVYFTIRRGYLGDSPNALFPALKWQLVTRHYASLESI